MSNQQTQINLAAQPAWHGTAGFSKIWLLLGVLILAGAGYYAYSIAEKAKIEPMVRIVGVTPNFKLIQIPSQECKMVTTKKMLKNPNSNVFKRMFSNQHPEYIPQYSNKQVCTTVDQESQVLTGYVIHYQFGEYLESLTISPDKVPPQLNSQLPLVKLQLYQTNIASPISANASAVN